MQATMGDTVRVQYTATLPDKRVVASCVGVNTLRFTIGSGDIFSGLQKTVIGMAPGERKQAKLEPSDAFGPYQDGLSWEMKRADLPDEIEGSVGESVGVKLPRGRAVQAAITRASDETVVIDANHPLAGREVVLDVALLEVVKPSQPK
jgi:peptidylprolyl isomerase